MSAWLSPAPQVRRQFIVEPRCAICLETQLCSAVWRLQVLNEVFKGAHRLLLKCARHLHTWHLQVLDEVFKGAHVEHQPKVSPSAATPTEVGCVASICFMYFNLRKAALQSSMVEADKLCFTWAGTHLAHVKIRVCHRCNHTLLLWS